MIPPARTAAIASSTRERESPAQHNTLQMCCNATQCNRPAGATGSNQPRAHRTASALGRCGHWAAAGSKRLRVIYGTRHGVRAHGRTAAADQTIGIHSTSSITGRARRGRAEHTGGGRGGRRAQPHRDQFLANNGVHVLPLQPPRCFGRGATAQRWAGPDADVDDGTKGPMRNGSVERMAQRHYCGVVRAQAGRSGGGNLEDCNHRISAHAG